MRFITRLVFIFLIACAAPALSQEAASPPAVTDQAAEDLIKILEDDGARAALIEKLRQTDPEAAEAAPEVITDFSIARRLAEYTRSVAEGASATVRAVGGVFVNFHQAFNGALSADYAALRDLLVNLVVVALGLFGSFLVLRLMANAVIARIAVRAQNQRGIRRIGAIGMATLVDAVTIVLAWALGYILALNAGTYPNGQMGINQTLLLNAFLIVELSKLAIRTVLAPRFTVLRMLPVADDNAAYWSFWMSRILSLLGYTFLFVSPLLAGVISASAAAAVQVLVMATATIIGIIIVLQNKEGVRLWLAETSGRRGHDGLGRLLAALGVYWHVLAIAYLLALLVVWFANPDEALPFMLGATIQSLIAIAVGSLIVTFISRFVTVGLRLPEDVQKRLPLLETRLQAFVPGVMTVVRWVVIAGIAVAVGQIWGLFNFVEWISSDEGLYVAGSIVSAALIVLVAIILHVVVASWVEYRLNTQMGKIPTPREKTLLNLFKNAFSIALTIFGTMLALAQIGVNIAPLLAGAGVLGLAIGFGAQKLVQDIITGIFIQFENVMNEGDVVEVAGRSGVVEKLTIRSVTIRDLTGTVHLIPFSSVDQVSNMMRGFSFHVAEIGVGYDSDIEAVKQAMRDAFAQIMQTEHKDEILDDLDMQGIIAFADSAITVRARIKTLPGKHWAIGRKYSEMVKQVFAERGIEIPYPHVTYVQSGDGRAPGNALRAPGRASKAEAGSSDA